MKRLLKKIISECKECPYMQWDEDTSCSNDSGVCRCKLSGKDIEWNTRSPAMPNWCELKTVK